MRVADQSARATPARLLPCSTRSPAAVALGPLFLARTRGEAVFFRTVIILAWLP